MFDLKPLFDDIDPNSPLIIAGPCSAETEEQVLSTARQLAAKGIKIFRAGIWKPRTKPGGFEGIGAEGLKWLQKVKEETGMKVATEVANHEHVRQALEAGVDLIWIGARKSANPFAMQAIEDTLAELKYDLPISLKIPSIPISNYGLAQFSVFIMQDFIV